MWFTGNILKNASVAAKIPCADCVEISCQISQMLKFLPYLPLPTNSLFGNTYFFVFFCGIIDNIAWLYSQLYFKTQL